MGPPYHGLRICERKSRFVYAAAPAKQPLAGDERKTHRGPPLSLAEYLRRAHMRLRSLAGNRETSR